MLRIINEPLCPIQFSFLFNFIPALRYYTSFQYDIWALFLSKEKQNIYLFRWGWNQKKRKNIKKSACPSCVCVYSRALSTWLISKLGFSFTFFDRVYDFYDLSAASTSAVGAEESLLLLQMGGGGQRRRRKGCRWFQWRVEQEREREKRDPIHTCSIYYIHVCECGK